MDLIISVISSSLIMLISLIICTLNFIKYYKNRKNNALLISISFLFFSIGWFSIFIGSIIPSSSIIGGYLAPLSMAITSVFVMLFFFNFLIPKYSKYHFIIIFLTILPFIIGLIIIPPDFSNNMIKYQFFPHIFFAFLISMSGIIIGIFFIIFSLKNKNILIKKKSLYFGIGFIIFSLSTTLTGISDNVILSLIFRFLVGTGLSIVLIGELIEK